MGEIIKLPATTILRQGVRNRRRERMESREPDEHPVEAGVRRMFEQIAAMPPELTKALLDPHTGATAEIISFHSAP